MGMFTRTTAFVLLVIWLPACAYRWRARTDTRSAIRAQQRDQARVTLIDGRQFVLRNPIVTEDSIVGTVQATQVGVVIPVGTRLAVALSEVANLELRESDAGRTFGNIILFGGLPLLIVVVAIAALTAPGCAGAGGGFC